jgi:hypothetical protein
MTTTTELIARLRRGNATYGELDKLAIQAADALETLQRERDEAVLDAEPTWVVNDMGELGVKVGSRFFFLYKGDNIEYGACDNSKDGIALHDDGTPMQYRIVGKREFGETCWPLKWIRNGRSQDKYTDMLVYTPGLSFGKPEDGDWKPLPAAAIKSGSEG